MKQQKEQKLRFRAEQQQIADELLNEKFGIVQDQLDDLAGDLFRVELEFRQLSGYLDGLRDAKNSPNTD